MKIIIRGDALREAAARQNKSLAELATAAGTDYRYLSRLLLGEHEPSAAMRRRLCDAVGLKFNRLFQIEHDTKDGET